MPTAAASVVRDRVCSNDPTLVKLHLVEPPPEYYCRPQVDDDDGVGKDDDDMTTAELTTTFQAFLQALRRNTSITYVFLERRFLRHLSPTEYADILHAIAAMKNVREVEIWSVRVPLSTLCSAFASSQKLDRLGLGMVTLTDTANCQGLAHHSTLQTFYLSDFRFLESENEGEEGQEAEAPNLDSLLEALGTCPRLGMVEIVNYQSGGLENNDCFSPHALTALADSTSIFHLRLRRLGLLPAHGSALAEAIARPIPEDGGDDGDVENHHRRRRLRVLHVGENQLGDAGSSAIVQAIVSYRRQSRQQGGHGGRGGGGGGIKDLSLRKNRITSTGCIAIADALLEGQEQQEEAVAAAAAGSKQEDEESALLEKLNLAMNAIEDRGGAALARLLLQQNHRLGLKQLELSRASMTDTGCCDLASAIRDNTSLLNLGLSYNKMTDATYIAFAAALRVNETLQSINLQVDRRELTTAGSAALAEMTVENYVLRDVCTLLGVGSPSSAHSRYADQIRLYLRLNHAGRQFLLQGRRGQQQQQKDGQGEEEVVAATKADWIHAIDQVRNLNGVFYLIKANPLICE